jgi:hypothetical protein
MVTSFSNNGGTQMDWELVGLVSLFVAAGLITAFAGLLGFTRTEKALGAVYFAGFAALLIVLSVFVSSDVPDIRTKADVDAWLARIENGLRLAMCLCWFCRAAATAFLVVAVMHIWRERSALLKKLRLEI